MEGRRVKDVMHRGVIVCFADRPLKEVAKVMVHNDIREVVVIDDNTEVCGMISDCLLVQAYGADLDAKVAGDVLIPHTVTISPEATLTEAVELMQNRQIRTLVIVAGEAHSRPGWPAGIISCTDIVREIAEL